MKYCKAFNIWEFPEELMCKIQPGQWVYAGNPADKGRWCGIKKSGTKVVAWRGNMQGHKDKQAYFKSLIRYAKG
ncbi:hypothetical protein M316_0034 [Nitrincola phage 1M3-16]|uniref:hypothetical protein n=1 Tax=Nitrincola phage 1M3-16 TaxID=1472912 RepID=UPI000444C455|nr:hypothetical protein GJ22_gp118 [Nitrincola phage 1M3-16]AHX01099.1 hypothetical protein M316_0034 [Nitrincola phage 1M3-16]